jgi:hypothetical protein
MEIEQLENQLLDLYNKCIDLNLEMNRIWEFHPGNPEWVNPISIYEGLKGQVSSLESEISVLKDRILMLKNSN